MKVLKAGAFVPAFRAYLEKKYIENGERNEGWNLLQSQYRKEHTGDIS